MIRPILYRFSSSLRDALSLARARLSPKPDEPPSWWPEPRRGVSGRYTVEVDGDSYGFTSRREASLFVGRLQVLTEKVAIFKDHGRRARGRGRVNR